MPRGILKPDPNMPTAPELSLDGLPESIDWRTEGIQNYWFVDYILALILLNDFRSCNASKEPRTVWILLGIFSDWERGGAVGHSSWQAHLIV